jgi:hypothetical protein
LFQDLFVRPQNDVAQATVISSLIGANCSCGQRDWRACER